MSQQWAKLHAQISRSRSFAAVYRESPEAAALFLLLLPHADVYGVMDAHPAVVKGAACPLLPMDADQVAEALQLLARHHEVVLYQDAEGTELLWIVAWSKWQETRWTHVGKPEHELPSCWQVPDSLRSYLAQSPSGSVADYFADRLEHYSTTTVPLPSGYKQDIDTDTDTDTEQHAPPDGDAALVEETKRDPGDDTPTQAAIRELWVAFDFGDLPRSPKGYSGLLDLVGTHGIPKVLRFAEYVRGYAVELPEGADGWKYFCKKFREGMNRDFEWDPEAKKARASPGKEPSAQTKAAIAANRTVA